MTQIFAKSFNKFTKIILILVGLFLGGFVFLFSYYFSPHSLEVGYMPKQPLPFSHVTHSKIYNLDCRYCHFSVETSATAGMPSTETCFGCHVRLRNRLPVFKKIFESKETGIPIKWTRIHKVPDYAYFDHSVHVVSGIGCATCHGRVDTMSEVQLVKPLSMGWCLDCHRNVQPYLRPADKITDMNWISDEKWIVKSKILAKKFKPPVESCSGCHR